MNSLIYVAHKWGDDPAYNTYLIKQICRAISDSGDIPIVPPLFFSWLDDSKPEERAQGMEMGMRLLRMCREVRVYSEATEGIRREVEAAQAAGIRVRWMAEEDTKVDPEVWP